jgi:hypothetical protein
MNASGKCRRGCGRTTPLSQIVHTALMMRSESSPANIGSTKHQIMGNVGFFHFRALLIPEIILIHQRTVFPHYKKRTPKQHTTGGTTTLGASPSRAVDTCNGYLLQEQWPSAATRRSAARRSDRGSDDYGAPADKDGCDRSCQQDCADGLKVAYVCATA